MTRTEPSRRLTTVVLLLIMVVAGGLRLANLNWDRGAHLHPDERFLSMVNDRIQGPSGPAAYFNTQRSPLNPANQGDTYVYGTAPLFLTKGVSTWLDHGVRTGAQPANAVVSGLDRVGIDLIGSDGEATFDADYRGEQIGRLLSALIDTLTTLAVFELARLAAGRRAGLAAALVWATTVLAIQHAHFFVVEPLLVLATAVALVASAHLALGRGRAVLVAAGVAVGVAGACKVSGLSVGVVVVMAVLFQHVPERRWRAVVIETIIAGTVAVITFRILQPYAFDGVFRLDERWVKALGELSKLQDGADVPPNVQWADRTPIVEPLGHLIRFGFGVPASLLAAAGVIGLARTPRWSSWRSQPVRVLMVAWVVLCSALFLPRWVSSMRYMLPAYPALAALAGVGAARLLRSGRALQVAGAALLVGCVLWGGAFVNGVYGREHPRLAAADWITEHAPDGSVLSFDEWDDGLPLTSPAAQAKAFASVSLAPFGTQTPDDVRKLAGSLDEIDYVVQTSDRITGSIGRVPGRYAPVLRYQRALEDGSLGFEQVARFATRPTLLGLEITDTGSEEAFRVYDHPTVRIWRKTPSFSLEQALVILQPDRAGASVHIALDKAPANGLLLRHGAASDPGASVGQSFDQIFPDRLPVVPLWWLAWWELTALVAVGWCGRLFRGLPGRGLGLTKVLGPMAVVVPLWFAIACGLVEFSRASAAAATAIAALVGVGVPRWRGEALDLFRTHRRAIVTVEVVTLVVFAAVLLLRAAIPDLWFHPTGGEKPFETAFFTSVARTSTLPPADPWYSGGAMNYYYGSWFSLAVPTRLLGIRPEVALNLAVATVASLVAAVSWSLGSALSRLRSPRTAGRRAGVTAGFLAAGSLLLVGNLDSARQRLTGVTPFDWWGVTRLNPPTTDINEFPAWSVLFGDPHPHLLALPVLLVIVAVLVAYVATPRTSIAVLVGIGLAWVRIDHTWDLPTLALLTVGAVAAAAALGTDGRRRRGVRAVGHLAVIGAASTVVAHPYVRTSQVFDSGLTLTTIRTPVGAFLLQYGIPLTITLLFLARQAWRARRSGQLPPVFRSTGGSVGVAVVAAGLVLAAVGYRGPVAGLALAVVAATLTSAVADLRRGVIGRGLAAALVAAGTGLVAVPEVWTVLNDIGRQNSVFKFGYTGWTLMGVGAAVLAADLVDSRSGPARWRWRGAVALVIAPGLLFWPSALPRRLDARFAHLPLTLDGRAWLAHGPVVVEANNVPPIDVTADEPLITWLRTHGRTGETLVEATGPSYTWVGRISVATGLPTVIGWNFHEKQQRRDFGNTVDERVTAVDDFYGRPDTERAQRVLATYRPDYVVVGTVEHALGDQAAIEALADLPGLTPAYRSGTGTVYRVDLVKVDRVLAVIDAGRIRAG